MVCSQTWTLVGEHWVVVECRRARASSIWSREHGVGSARNSAPDSDTLATASSADAIATGGSSAPRAHAQLGREGELSTARKGCELKAYGASRRARRKCGETSGHLARST